MNEYLANITFDKPTASGSKDHSYMRFRIAPVNPMYLTVDYDVLRLKTQAGEIFVRVG